MKWLLRNTITAYRMACGRYIVHGMVRLLRCAAVALDETNDRVDFCQILDQAFTGPGTIRFSQTGTGSESVQRSVRSLLRHSRTVLEIGMDCSRKLQSSRRYQTALNSLWHCASNKKPHRNNYMRYSVPDRMSDCLSSLHYRTVSLNTTTTNHIYQMPP